MFNLIGGLIGGFGNSINAAISTAHNMEMNRHNLEFQKHALDKQLEIAKYGKELDLQMNQANIDAQMAINKANLDNQNRENEIMRMREDNAVQRRMTDLRNSGINPLLAGAQAAESGIGAVITQNAPVADTTIGGRYAQTYNDAIQKYGQSLDNAVQRQIQIDQVRTLQIDNVYKALSDIDLKGAQKKEILERIEKMKKEALNIIEDTLLKSKQIEKLAEDIKMSEKQRDFLKEQITTEPFKRALMSAETTEHLQNISNMQQKLLNLEEEQRESIMRQAKILADIDISKKTKEKLQEEISNLMLDGDMKRFENSLKELTKATELSGDYISMFGDMIRALFFGKMANK